MNTEKTIEKTLKVYRKAGVEAVLPEIRLSGLWVREFGYEIGDYIRVKIENNKILIKKIEIEQKKELK